MSDDRCTLTKSEPSIPHAFENPLGSTVDNIFVSLFQELAEITLDPPPNCSAGPKGDNMYEWVSTILGPPGEKTVYLNLSSM